MDAPCNSGGHGTLIRQFLIMLVVSSAGLACAQTFPHQQAHAHNDYEHQHPLWDALQYGFLSVEADVHLKEQVLRVSHNKPGANAPTLDELYLKPLDSLIQRYGQVYPDYGGPFYLMIDLKTDAERTYRVLLEATVNYPRLGCGIEACPVKIFISGNRPVNIIEQEGYRGLALDGRPADLGKGFSTDLMPVISDHFGNWSAWNGKSDPRPGDLDRIRELANRVHAEGKKLRLWAIPDNERAWSALLDAGVDLINTDRLEALHLFLTSRGG
jgi:hypothetical protein